MKRIYMFFNLLLIIFCSLQNICKAQCGVTPGLACLPPVNSEELRPNINAGPTVFDPNWYAYSWSWTVNGYLVSFDSILDPNNYTLTNGFNEVCLTVSATNSLTGDSCTKMVCNIFQSTGPDTYIELDVYVSGLDVTAISNWISGSTPVTGSIDWGDGTVDPNPGGVHTYAAPGEYLITAGAAGLGLGWTNNRKVQVANGGINMDVSNFTLGAASGCYPVTISPITSTPPFVTAGVGLIGHASFQSSQPLINGNPIQFPVLPQYPIVPGQALVQAFIQNSNLGAVRFKGMFFDVCGVVPDTITGYVFDDQDADGIKDPGEPGVQNIIVGLHPDLGGNPNYYVLTDSSGFYSILAPNAQFVVSSDLPAGTVCTIPGSNAYYIDGAASNNFPLYNFGVANLNTVISGKVYFDYNQDSVRNVPPDRDFENVTVKAFNSVNGLSYYENTTNAGSYSFYLSSGNYSISAISSLLDSADFYPDTISINSTGGTFTNQNIACHSSVSGNLGIRLFGANEARPGFDYTTDIEVTNGGFDTISGTVVVVFDSILTVSGIVPVNGIIDNVNYTVTWNTGLMPAASNLFFSIISNIPVATPLGTSLQFYGQVNVDVAYTENDLSNNNYSFWETVVGSYDPNDKNVDPIGVGVAGNVLHSDRLHYRIRFQNTGTASALNVIVQDEIDADLDMSTFLMSRTSHAFDMVTNGNTVTWKFLNINLPDSNSNEPASHGYIEYSIKAIQGLTDGTEIENTAAIFFDFNTPIITNTTLNTLQSTIVSIPENVSDSRLSLYPVPVSNELTISLSTGNAEKVIAQVVDVNGKLIRTIYNGISSGEMKFTVNTSIISSGVYAVRIISNNKILRKVFVKE